ncbi:MAG: DUF192 domain-containing protein [Haloarculaceae archaeon]
MRVVHESGEGARTLASTVEFAETFREQTLGLMFRESVPEDFALVFEFGRAGWRSIHMLFVRMPLDVLWLVDGEVRQYKTLQPWRGIGLSKADTVVELPAGAAEGVTKGDRIRIEE